MWRNSTNIDSSGTMKCILISKLSIEMVNMYELFYLSKKLNSLKILICSVNNYL